MKGPFQIQDMLIIEASLHITNMENSMWEEHLHIPTRHTGHKSEKENESSEKNFRIQMHANATMFGVRKPPGPHLTSRYLH